MQQMDLASKTILFTVSICHLVKIVLKTLESNYSKTRLYRTRLDQHFLSVMYEMSDLHVKRTLPDI
jgi:hypothetical protein